MKKIIYIVLSIITISCAQFVAPTGGAKDEVPPELLSSVPKNKTLNYKDNTFSFEFNELIDASTIYNELFIVPNPPGQYEAKVKNNVLNLKFDKKFADSTTYTFNFRNSVKDLTERNASKNFKLVFSTGPEIDSLKISGFINNIFDKEPALDVTVGLYTHDTLTLKQKKPLYMVKTDSSGRFEIENIKPNNYFLLAIKDKKNNLIFDEKEDWLTFYSDSIYITKDTIFPQLEIYPANNSKNKLGRNRSLYREVTTVLDKPTYKLQVDFENPSDTANVTFTNTNTHLHFYKMVDTDLDTIRTKIILTDSLLNSDTLTHKVFFEVEKGKKQKIETIKVTSKVKNNVELNNNLSYDLYFEKPIVKFDTNNIIFKTDTLQKEKLRIEQLTPFHIRLSLKTKAEKQVELLIPSNTFVNFIGDTNSVINLKNIILQKDELGILEGYTDDKKIRKIAILQDENRKNDIDLKYFTDKFKFEDIIPGNYHIKVIFDENENGIWDPGNIVTKKQPERILSSPEPIRIRANFEISQKIE